MTGLVLLLPMLAVGGLRLEGTYARPEAPFAAAAGEAGSTAVARTDPAITGWAKGYEEYLPGSGVDAVWQQPEEALGPAGTESGAVVVLGRGGKITLTFARPLRDGAGPDFAVFENGFGSGFLELAYVEVSSDGKHFVRFPAYSLTAAPVPGFGTIDPTLITGLAGKYRLGYGTPFDLGILEAAYQEAVKKEDWNGPEAAEFSQAYRDALVANFPFIDLQRVTHVRVVDIAGDGSALDAEGFPIYDPYPTSITTGFDLDGVAVLKEATELDPSAPPAPEVGLGENEDREPELRLRLELDPDSNLSPTIEASTELQTWNAIAPPVREEVVTGTGSDRRREVTYGIPLDDSVRFIRVLYTE